MCCPTRKTPVAPTYEVSVSVQPKPITVSVPVQPVPVKVASTMTTVKVAHGRFYSTENISLTTALRSAPPVIETITEEGKK